MSFLLFRHVNKILFYFNSMNNTLIKCLVKCFFNELNYSVLITVTCNCFKITLYYTIVKKDCLTQVFHTLK